MEDFEEAVSVHGAGDWGLYTGRGLWVRMVGTT